LSVILPVLVAPAGVSLAFANAGGVAAVCRRRLLSLCGSAARHRKNRARHNSLESGILLLRVFLVLPRRISRRSRHRSDQISPVSMSGLRPS
jgi:hypothetical protein